MFPQAVHGKKAILEVINTHPHAPCYLVTGCVAGEWRESPIHGQRLNDWIHDASGRAQGYWTGASLSLYDPDPGPPRIRSNPYSQRVSNRLL